MEKEENVNIVVIFSWKDYGCFSPHFTVNFKMSLNKHFNKTKKILNTLTDFFPKGNITEFYQFLKSKPKG